MPEMGGLFTFKLCNSKYETYHRTRSLLTKSPQAVHKPSKHKKQPRENPGLGFRLNSKPSTLKP